MAFVDAHVHIYPEKIAAKAVEAVGAFYELEMYGDGTPDQVAHDLAQTPITHCIVHSVATTPRQVPSINAFIAKSCENHPNFIGFMAMHQDTEDPLAAIEDAVALGLKGIKIHPYIQKVNLDDDRLMRVYEIAERKGLPVTIHTGDYRYDYSHPARMQRVLHEFPNLVVDAAHFGGWSIFDLAVEYMEHEKCFMDCSSSMPWLGRRRVRELIEIYGADRILFGSDFPMWSPVREYEFLESLGLAKSDLEKIYWHNAERFLDMTIE